MIIYFANHITYLPFGSQENRNVHKIHRSALSSYSLVVIIVLTRTNMAADGRLLLISLFSLFCVGRTKTMDSLQTGSRSPYTILCSHILLWGQVNKQAVARRTLFLGACLHFSGRFLNSWPQCLRFTHGGARVRYR